MLELAADADEPAIVASAAELSVAVMSIGQFRARSKGRPALVLGYGRIDDVLIPEGVERLASVIERC
jgi:DNA-binding transcriptional MocR family regulator